VFHVEQEQCEPQVGRAAPAAHDGLNSDHSLWVGLNWADVVCMVGDPSRGTPGERRTRRKWTGVMNPHPFGNMRFQAYRVLNGRTSCSQVSEIRVFHVEHWHGH